MSFEIFKNDQTGQFYFHLKAANNQIILVSEAYTRKENAEKGIQSVIQNVRDDSNFEIRESPDGQQHFVLKASNGEIIGHSETYQKSAGLQNGIRSVQENAPKAKVEDLTQRKKK